MPPQIVSLAEVTESQFTQLFDQFEGNLENVIEAAEDWVMKYLRWNPISSSEVEIQRLTGDRVFFKAYPVTELTSLEVAWNYSGPWTTIPTTDFFPDFDAGYIDTYNLGSGRFVRLTYTRGLVNMPNAIKQAIIIKTALLASPDYEIFGSGDSKAPGLGHYDATVLQLIDPYKRRAVGT